jgi:SAM-dependent methyltransferase
MTPELPLQQRLQDRWEQMHLEGNVSALTGTSFVGHLQALGIKAQELPRVPRLLCIGVGLGGWVYELSRLGYNVTAVDCAEQALCQMRFCRKVHSSRLHLLPDKHFDLAMSVWVAAHMPDQELLEQMRQVIRSLRPGGRFYCQYSEKDEKGGPQVNPDDFVRSCAGMNVRSRQEFARLVESAGGKVVGYPVQMPSPAYKVVVVSAAIEAKP